MSTPNDILRGAYGRSTKNQPGQIANEDTELLDIIGQALRGLFMFATRLNPPFFGTSTTVNFDGDKWPVPSDVEHLFRLEDPDQSNQVVEVVPFDDRAIAAPAPAVYHLGGAFYSAGNPNDPTSGNLVAFYAKQATLPSALTEELDSFWPSSYDELLELEVAIYLAMKDDRMSEVQALQADRDRWAVRFAAHVEHFAPTTTDRFVGGSTLQAETVVPLGDLLAGGSEAF